MAIDKINHTQLSNDFIDNYMKKMSGAENKVFIAISRKTIGWQKDVDKISISQIEKMTGLSNRHIIRAINKLSDMDIIKTIKENGKTTVFEINYLPDKRSQVKTEPVTKGNNTPDKRSQVKTEPVTKGNNTPDKRSQEPLTKGHTQKKVKETIQKKKNKEKSFHHQIIEHFNIYRKKQSGTGIIDFKKEGKQTKLLIEKLNKFDDSKVFTEDISLKFWELVKSDNKFWNSQPYLPSVLNSLFDRVLTELKNNPTRKSDYWDKKVEDIK